MISSPPAPAFFPDPQNPVRRVPAVALAGLSGSGKTPLICALLTWLTARGYRVAVLKHSHKPDPAEGKDTWRFRHSGAQLVALAAPGMVQLTLARDGDPPLEEVLPLLLPNMDLVLVEGYKRGPLPKVAVLGDDPPPQPPDYPHLIALVSSRPVDSSLPVFHPQEVPRLGQFLEHFCGLESSGEARTAPDRNS